MAHSLVGGPARQVFIGARLTINGHDFELVDAPQGTLRFMEGHCDLFQQVCAWPGLRFLRAPACSSRVCPTHWPVLVGRPRTPQSDAARVRSMLRPWVEEKGASLLQNFGESKPINATQLYELLLYHETELTMHEAITLMRAAVRGAEHKKAIELGALLRFLS